MDFDTFIDTAWADHAEQASAVAARLQASLRLITAPAQIAPFAGIVTHVFGEHLGRWDEGIALLGALRARPAFDGGDAAEAALRRGCAVLRVTAAALAGESAPPFELAGETSADERASVLAAAASALAGRQAFGSAIRHYAEALAIAELGLPPASPAHRALAVGGNNLAVALEKNDHRSVEETAGMLMAAEAGLHYWKLAGTWLNEERAYLRLTHSRMAAERPVDAIASAERCVAICQAHGAPALERFFGGAALALAQHAAGRFEAFAATRDDAETLHAQIPADDHVGCADVLAQIRALSSAP